MQPVVKLLQAAVTGEGDDGAGLGAHLQEMPPVAGLQGSLHRGQALKTWEKLPKVNLLGLTRHLPQVG